jgi:hypothetical protein
MNYPVNNDTRKTKEEMLEDDEVTQMLKEAGMSLAPTLDLKTYESKISQNNGHKVYREDSISSNKIPGVCNPHNNSSLCLYGTESGRKMQSNYKLNISNLQKYKDDDLQYNDLQLERIESKVKYSYN